MSTQPEPAAAAGAHPQVGPSLVVRLTLRPMTTVLNPLITKLAGRRHFGMAAHIVHIGRRSGRRYTTPVSARRVDDTIMIPLTFGSRSDWSRNVRAAGGCSIRLNGEHYEAVQPEIVPWPQAKPLVRSAFGRFERLAFRVFGIQQFLRLRIAPAAP